MQNYRTDPNPNQSGQSITDPAGSGTLVLSSTISDTASISDCLAAAAGPRAPASVERGAAAALDSAGCSRSGLPPGSSASLL